MKFNIWFIITLALLPFLALFVGMSVADGFASSASWEVIAAIGLGIAVVVRLVLRGGRAG